MAGRGDNRGRISPELDDLSCELMGNALDRLAEGIDVNVLLVVADAEGNVCDYEFADDGEAACLEGARSKVRSLVRMYGNAELGMGEPRYYALCYEGAVADDDDCYADALIMEFGEKGCPAFSAYSLFEGRGAGEDFVWSDPAPAGSVERLL